MGYIIFLVRKNWKWQTSEIRERGGGDDCRGRDSVVVGGTT